MTDTTTIEITESQRQRLRDINQQSAKAALGDLLDAYEDADSGGDAPVALSFDDVRAACGAAVREELEDLR